MKQPNNIQTADAKAPVTALHTTVSKDGQWRTYHKFTGLMQFIPAGTFYARCKVNGKAVRASLDTDVFTTAKTKLADKLKELREPKHKAGTFAQHLETFKSKTEHDVDLSPTGRVFRLRCADRLVKSWPKLVDMQVDEITPDDVEAWWQKYSVQYNPQFVNHTLVYLRFILRKVAKLTIDPTAEIKPVGVKRKELVLPTMAQFQTIVQAARTSGWPEAEDSGDIIEFLAYSGCRVSEAQGVFWKDVDLVNGQVRVPCAKRRRSSREDDFRLVPIIPPMKTLLQRIQARRNLQPHERVILLDGCRRALTRGCKVAGCKRMTHHDLRHLFASVCIEAAVDIQTISRWLGHSDGGVLAQRIYGHLRKEHSLTMAAKVTFGQAVPENVVQMPQAATA